MDRRYSSNIRSAGHGSVLQRHYPQGSGHDSRRDSPSGGGLKEGDIIAWQREGNAIWITRAHYTLESAFGSVEPHSHPEDIDALTDAAKAAKAEATVEEFGKR